jgi:hypothetical protein
MHQLHRTYALCMISAKLAHVAASMHNPRTMFVQLIAKPKSKRLRPCREARP